MYFSFVLLAISFCFVVASPVIVDRQIEPGLDTPRPQPSAQVAHGLPNPAAMRVLPSSRANLPAKPDFQMTPARPLKPVSSLTEPLMFTYKDRGYVFQVSPTQLKSTSNSESIEPDTQWGNNLLSVIVRRSCDKFYEVYLALSYPPGDADNKVRLESVYTDDVYLVSKGDVKPSPYKRMSSPYSDTLDRRFQGARVSKIGENGKGVGLRQNSRADEYPPSMFHGSALAEPPLVPPDIPQVHSYPAPPDPLLHSSTAGTIPRYGQCGGSGWTGGTVCVAPYTCTFSGPIHAIDSPFVVYYCL